jgi:CubicO group peptidase (beta-lactamase class C family)
VIAIVRSVLLVSATSLAFGRCCAAADNDRFTGLDAYVYEAMQTWEVPVLAIAVVKDGEIVLARGYGACSAAFQATRPNEPGAEKYTAERSLL